MAPGRLEALALFDRAIKLAPGNVAVRYRIALSFLGFDGEKYRSPHPDRASRRRGEARPPPPMRNLRPVTQQRARSTGARRDVLATRNARVSGSYPD